MRLWTKHLFYNTGSKEYTEFWLTLGSHSYKERVTICSTITCQILVYSEFSVKDVTLKHVNVTLEHVNVTLEHVNVTLEHVNATLEHVNVTLEHVNVTLEQVNRSFSSYQAILIGSTIKQLTLPSFSSLEFSSAMFACKRVSKPSHRNTNWLPNTSSNKADVSLESSASRADASRVDIYTKSKRHVSSTWEIEITSFFGTPLMSKKINSMQLQH